MDTGLPENSTLIVKLKKEAMGSGIDSPEQSKGEQILKNIKIEIQSNLFQRPSPNNDHPPTATTILKSQFEYL
jgi:hypothetical protein